MKKLVLVGGVLLLVVGCAAPAEHKGDMEVSTDPMKMEECMKSDSLRELKFNGEFFAEMKSGKKTATTRRGVRCVAVGDVLAALTNDGKKMGELTITKAQVLKFDEISAELAASENATVEELQDGLREIYGPDIEKSVLTAVYFEYRAQ